MLKYIAIDVETGGISIDTSLLTASFILLDEKIDPKDSLDIFIKPENGVYKVEGKSLEINGIDLKEHDKKAITNKEAGTKLYEWLMGHYNKDKVKFIPIGHNIRFDIFRINEQLLHNKAWDMYVSHRSLDTGVIYQFFKVLGIVPNDDRGSLDHLCDVFKVKNNRGKYHTAKQDAEMSADVFKSMIYWINDFIKSPLFK